MPEMSKEFNGIFDMNLWYGASGPGSSYTAGFEDIKKYIRYLKNRSGEAMVFATSQLSYTYDPVEGDSLLAALLKEEASIGGIMVFPNYFISCENEFEAYLLKRIHEGFRFIRLYKAHKYELRPWAFNKIYAALAKYRFPVIISLDDIDITGNKAIEWDLIYEIASGYKNMPVILDGGNSKEMMYSGYIFKLLETCNNIFIETHNLLGFNQLEDIACKYGSERLVLGSYYPYYPHYLSLERIRFARMTFKEKDNICYLNIKNIIGKIRI
jgi:hypothetical protein